MKTLIHALLCIALIVCVTGCGEYRKIANDLDAYADRLQSYTGIALVEVDFSYQLHPPAKSSFKQDVADISINLREFYALNECALNQLVAQRNTTLGKIQLPSARFAYESRLLVELKKCAQNLEGNADKSTIVDKLNLWTSDKQNQLPIAWANLVTQSSEVYTHITAANGFISGNASDNFQATKQAIRFLLNSETEHPVSLAELELHLQQLSNSPLLARKWRTQLLLTQKLNYVSPLLQEYLSKNQCETLQDKESIEIMQNIFRKLFAETIQPLAAELNKYHYQLSPLIEKFVLSPHFTESFGAYLTKHNDISYQAYTESMRTHITLWQKVFVHCN